MSIKTCSDDNVTMICPSLSCRRTLSAPATSRGKVMRCPYCDVPFRVPEQATTKLEAAEAAGRERHKR